MGKVIWEGWQTSIEGVAEPKIGIAFGDRIRLKAERAAKEQRLLAFLLAADGRSGAVAKGAAPMTKPTTQREDSLRKGSLENYRATPRGKTSSRASTAAT